MGAQHLRVGSVDFYDVPTICGWVENNAFHKMLWINGNGGAADLPISFVCFASDGDLLASADDLGSMWVNDGVVAIQSQNRVTLFWNDCIIFDFQRSADPSQTLGECSLISYTPSGIPIFFHPDNLEIGKRPIRMIGANFVGDANPNGCMFSISNEKLGNGIHLQGLSTGSLSLKNCGIGFTVYPYDDQIDEN